MAAAPLLVVATNLGHTDTRMVEKHYGHLAADYVAREIRKAAPRFDVQPETNVALRAEAADSTRSRELPARGRQPAPEASTADGGVGEVLRDQEDRGRSRAV
jgi:hypothetical protein